MLASRGASHLAIDSFSSLCRFAFEHRALADKTLANNIEERAHASSPFQVGMGHDPELAC